MAHIWKYLIWISLICGAIVILPLSTAQGSGADIAGVGELSRMESQPFNAPSPQVYPLTGLSAVEDQMIQLVNQARAGAGLPLLTADSSLVQTARLKSQDMVSLNYFAHQSPTYGSPFDMMNQFGIAFQSAGENIACNQTVTTAHQALMNSQGHRENILNPVYTLIGIGIVNGGPCGQMYTEQFVGR